ncbi:MAG: FtsK/SpoIIIE domain-containing protein [Dehalococcoidia bacterium]
MPFKRKTSFNQLQQQVNRLTQAAEDAAFWHNRLLDIATAEHERANAEADTGYQQRLAQADTETQRAVETAAQARGTRIAVADQLTQETVAGARAARAAAVECARAQARVIEQVAGRGAKDWEDTAWDAWTPPVDADGARALCIGRLRESLPRVEGLEQSAPLDIPALAPFLGGGHLVFQAPLAGRAEAIGAIQSAVLRLLASIPPGKLRFTFFDPIGLGENVAAFMRLADFDPLLSGVRALTEPEQIERRLVELTAHMSDVIQKYLRNEFATIEEFNANAGEVSQPYHVVVALDTPAGLSSVALQRLLGIMQTGPRCGVYCIILLDPSRPLPEGIERTAFRQNATAVLWDGARFIWDDEIFRSCTLELSRPPDLALSRRWDKTVFGQIITTVGKESRESGRVEVSFRRVATLFRDQLGADPEAYPGLILPVDPGSERSWWLGDAASGLTAPIGRAGASRVHCLTLGHGAAHHALIAGRTGSGKSTLLHVLITGLALAYSPDEVELYLVDFKKGVEFKTYATHRLPHASVVAIGSDRAFGLSVLQGLDGELRRRGDLFRAAQASDLFTFRSRRNSNEIAMPLPRIVLVLDEFQELFAANDTIAAEATQILDRLARQGRAFGIHLVLATQSLAGAFSGDYALARSTVAQMQVRIALPCDEIDSRLILAENNPAARTLDRPGAALYNAAGGAQEANDPLQVAWLPAEERDGYLARLRELAVSRHLPERAQLIFEGASATWSSGASNVTALPEPSPDSPEGRGIWPAA